MGKTSVTSRLNLPGKIGWLTMEVPGFLLLLYLMFTLPEMNGIDKLPWENKAMATVFVRPFPPPPTSHTKLTSPSPHQVIHYLYRAILFPIIAPSMSPIHILIWLSAICFQLINAISIGGWLGAYGPTTRAEWANHQTNYVAAARMELGLMLWAIVFAFPTFPPDERRESRRAAARKQEKLAREADPSTGKAKAGIGKMGVDKVYVIPKNGLFKWLLFPHYLFEWFEWTGFWIMGGANFTPGRTFVLNEVSTMLPRAVQGKRWYIERFGKEKVAGKAAIIPGIL
jgi:3-oxo-5-alpha-steroid 4-dehydrogenase 1